MPEKHSLQKRLLLIFSGLGVVLVCVSLLLSVLFGQSFRKDISERNLRLVSAIAGQVKLSLDHHTNELLQLSRDMSKAGIDNLSVKGQMDRILEYHPLITKIYLLNKEGSVLRVVPDNPQLLGLDMSGQPYYQWSAEEDQRGIHWSGEYVSSEIGKKTITVSVVFSEGILAAHLDIDFLNEIVRSINPMEEGFITLIDSNGNNILDSVFKFKKEKVDFFSYYSVRNAFDGEDGSYEEEIGGVKGLSSTYMIREIGWVVHIFQPNSGTYGVVDRLIVVTSMILILALAGAFFISMGLLKKVMLPIKNLAIQSRNVASGGYNVSVRTGYSEFEELTESFNMMARAIEAREDDLKRSESRYKELFYNNPLPLMIYEANDLNVLDVSQAAVTDYGYSRDEFIKMKVPQIWVVEDVPPARKKALPGNLRRFKTGIWKHRKKDGNIIRVDISSHEIIFKGKEAILSICRDVTGNILVEEALRESQERFRATLESIGDPIIILDPEMNVTWANKIAIRDIGYFPNEKCYISSRGTDEPCRECPAVESLKDEMTYRSEEVITRADGITATYLVHTTPMYDNKGDVTGIVKSHRDVTDMKLSEEKLLESLCDKEVLLKEIHHRVKNNLQAISGLIDMQSNYTSDLWTKKVLQDSQNRIMSMALIHEKLYEMDDLKRIDFGDYINYLVKHLARIYDVKNKGIDVEIAYDNVLLNVDTALPCGLIVTELVSNSLKHAFPNNEGGKIKIFLKRKGPDRFVISVEDDGIGMRAELNKLSINSLGLHLVYSYVEFLSGVLETPPGEGTHFRITFSEYEECLVTEL